MNREIKFRAKKNKDNSWVYGLLTNDMKGHYRINFDAKYFSCIVKSETIGQFVGKQDKNGKEIYEGDILIHIYMGSIFKVEYSERNAAFMLIYPTNEGYNMGIYDIENCFKVIGNIYDNPELFKED